LAAPERSRRADDEGAGATAGRDAKPTFTLILLRARPPPDRGIGRGDAGRCLFQAGTSTTMTRLWASSRGQITGVYSDISPDTQDPDTPERGFLLDRGKLTRIDVPGAVQTRAVGINNRGQVVGEYTDADGMVHGFLWDKGRFTTFDGPDGTGASFTDINDRGEIVGAYCEVPGVPPLHGLPNESRPAWHAPGAGQARRRLQIPPQRFPQPKGSMRMMPPALEANIAIMIRILLKIPCQIQLALT
jgi:probable HAF family extracellular repeat protein